MALNAFEKKLLGEMLDQAIQELSCNGCNDLEVAITDENLAAVKKLIRETEDEDDAKSLIKNLSVGDDVCLTDFVVLRYFRDRLCGE